MLLDRCLSCPVCLSMTLMYCGQMVGWIKMPLCTDVGRSPGDIVLDGHPAPPPKRGTAAHSLFGPCLLWPTDWMDQDASWCRGKPRPRPHCVRLGPSSSPPQKGHSSPHFLAHVCCGQTARWIKIPHGTEVSLGPGNIVSDRDPAPPPP